MKLRQNVKSQVIILFFYYDKAQFIYYVYAKENYLTEILYSIILSKIVSKMFSLLEINLSPHYIMFRKCLFFMHRMDLDRLLHIEIKSLKA